MIGYLRGKVTHLLTDYCLLDVQGVGYRVFVAGSTRNHLRLGEEAMLFTHLSVREDAMLLYGFYSQQEYDLFQLLISVSGVGPKVALGILSAITVESLCRAIQQKQASVLTKLPGIGKKSAECKNRTKWFGANGLPRTVNGSSSPPMPLCTTIPSSTSRIGSIDPLCWKISAPPICRSRRGSDRPWAAPCPGRAASSVKSRPSSGAA